MNAVVLPLGLASMTAGVMVALAVLVRVLEDRRAVARSLTVIATGSVGLATTGVESVAFRQRVLIPTMDRFTVLGRRLTPVGAATRLASQLDLAGNPSPWTLERVLAVKALGAVALPALAAVLFSDWNLGRAVLLTAPVAACGFFLPNILVYNAATKRQAVIQKELPDSLDLLMISVEAGMGFDAAINHVAQNTTGPLSGEFFRVLQEMQMQSRSDSFRALGERTTVTELRTFVSALVQADALGIPIGRVLREQAKEMRLKRRQRAEEQAMKVPVKVLFPMVVFILPVIFVIILAPAGMELAATVKGQ